MKFDRIDWGGWAFCGADRRRECGDENHGDGTEQGRARGHGNPRKMMGRWPMWV